MAWPETVKLVEVGPRDGLQNEPRIIDTNTKVELVRRLTEAGLAHIEVSSFVSARRIPQLADAEAVFAALTPQEGVRYSALVPNERGMARAEAAGVDTVAVFTAASETFCRKNIHCSIAQSLERFEPVVSRARQRGMAVRAYVSCVAGCPYEGPVDPQAVAGVVQRLAELGCEEISLGDTIGVATPRQVLALLAACRERVPVGRLAVHFHDTRGQALANIMVSLEQGVRTVDAAVAGLGGCPFAPGAGGNVATEDVVYLLHGLGVRTGVDLPALIETGRWISQCLQRCNQSKVGLAGVPYGDRNDQTTP